MLIFVIVKTVFAVSQTEAIKVEGVSEPPELTASPKNIKQPTATELELFEIVGDLNDKTKIDSAKSALNKLIEDHPGYSDAYFLRAYGEACILESHDFPAIIDDVRNAILHTGAELYNSTDYYSLLGRIELETGHFKGAVGDLEKAMIRDVSVANRVFNIEGTTPERKSKFCVWNLTDLDSLAAHLPTDYRVWLFKGLYYEFFSTFDERYYQKALDNFQKAAELNPKSPLPSYFIGQVHTQASFWTKKAWASDADRDKETSIAAQAYSRAISLDPNYLPAYEERASAYLNLKEYAFAINDYKKVLTLDPENATAFSDRGVAEMESGQYWLAKGDFSEAIERKHDGDSFLPNLHEYRGDVEVKLGTYRDAVGDYTKAIELNLANEIFLLSLQQFRALYPEYDDVSNAEILQKLHGLFFPNMKYEDFSKQLVQNNGKWEVSFLLSDLYEKRGDTYLRIGDYRRGVLDFHRIFKGVPQMAPSTDRWRRLGRDSSGDNYYLDVRTAEFSKPGPARFWIKFINKKDTRTIKYEVDCNARKLNTSHMTVNDPSGSVLDDSDLSGGWEEAIPDTVGEQLLNGACFN